MTEMWQVHSWRDQCLGQTGHIRFCFTILPHGSKEKRYVLPIWTNQGVQLQALSQSPRLMKPQTVAIPSQMLPHVGLSEKWVLKWCWSSCLISTHLIMFPLPCKACGHAQLQGQENAARAGGILKSAEPYNHTTDSLEFMDRSDGTDR